MATRVSGRKRRKNDLYETPAWVVADGLALHVNLAGLKIKEPGCGNGKLMAALESAGASVQPSDTVRHSKFPRRTVDQWPWLKLDFVAPKVPPETFMAQPDALVFNPPYGPQGRLAERFIERGLEYLRADPRLLADGSPRFMAVLLPSDFDAASTRAHMFEQCPEFAGEIKLRRRILWFDKPRKDGKKNRPSSNHSWFIWKVVRPGGFLDAFAPGAPPRLQPSRQIPVKLYAPRSTVKVVPAAVPAPPPEPDLFSITESCP